MTKETPTETKDSSTDTTETATKTTETATKTTSDLGAKTVFRNLRLVATLFKNFTDEFRTKTIEEIEECIEKDSKGHPLELKDELYSLSTGYVRLDTLLEAKVPGTKNESVRIRFNIETQSYLSPRYSLTDRIQIYAAMLLATQNKESKGRDKYRNLKRSYTIWICPRAPKTLEGKIAAYGVLPYNKPPPEIELNSLMDIALVFPAKPVDDLDYKSVTDMLGLIFTKDDIKKRRKLLRQKYNISLNLKSLMEVEHFTDWISEAKEDGYDDGYGDGYGNGWAEGKAESVVGIMKKLGCSAEEAMEIIDVPEDRKEEILDLVETLSKN